MDEHTRNTQTNKRRKEGVIKREWMDEGGDDDDCEVLVSGFVWR